MISGFLNRFALTSMLPNTHIAGHPVALSPGGTAELQQLSYFWSWSLAQVPLHYLNFITWACPKKQASIPGSYKLNRLARSQLWHETYSVQCKCMHALLEVSQNNLALVTEDLRKYQNQSPHSSKLAFKPQAHPPVSKLFICPKSRRNGMNMTLMVSSSDLGNCVFLLWEYLSLCACSLACFTTALLELLTPYRTFLVYDCFMKTDESSGALLLKVSLSAWG